MYLCGGRVGSVYLFGRDDGLVWDCIYLHIWRGLVIYHVDCEHRAIV